MIILDQNYWLENDSYNWVLKYKATRMEVKDGAEVAVTSKDQSCHGELRFALAKYFNSVTKVSDNVKELIAAIKAAHATIDRVKVYFDTKRNYIPDDSAINLSGGPVTSNDISSTAGYIHENDEVPGFTQNSRNFISKKEFTKEYPLTPDDLEDLL